MNTQPFLWKQVLAIVNSGQQPSAEQWQALSADERELIELLQKEQLTAHAVEFVNEIDEDDAWQKLHGNIQTRLPRHTTPVYRMRWLKYAAVVAGILVLGGIAFFLMKKEEGAKQVVAGTYITEPANPKRATLVLANGQQIALDKSPDSKLQQDQTDITNIDTSLLAYNASAGATKPAGYNTLIVPRGGLYKIQLADGSEVWLNAETRLRYPVHFNGVDKRTVYLESGEAYFKVKHNVAQPFIVSANGMNVRVTGTEFNVNTYTNNYATTLAHGSVEVSAGANLTALQPGQQSVWAGGAFTRKEVDVDTYTAWIYGQIVFEETTLGDVMNNLGRQYDLTVEFATPQLKEKRFGGRFRKTAQVEDILTAIGKAGNLEFSIKGKTIIVSPGTMN